MKVYDDSSPSEYIPCNIEPDIVKDVPENAVGSPPEDPNEISSESETESEACGAYFTGIFGCMPLCFLQPFASLVGTKKKNRNDIWEIPFEEITEMQWIGSGAQGAVFLGKWRNRDVAIKKVRTQGDTDIKHLKDLDHCNIVKFMGVCSQSPSYCLVMEYCPCGQLYDALRNEKEVTPNLLVNWARQIAGGMAYLHLHQIIHRDLKSPNILISHQDTLKISDFGTWKPMSDKSAKMTFTGTVAWMAPEVIRNDPCSEKVDIWSYGVLIWELLTAEVPYKGVDYSALIWGVGNSSLKLPVPSTCPEGFKLLLSLCWKSKPKNRPSFRQILMHIDIAAADVVAIPKKKYFNRQVSWRQEVDEYFDWLKSQGSQLTLLDDDLVAKKREEIIQVRQVRKQYEDRLAKANALYAELDECMKQLQEREEELKRKEEKIKQLCTTNNDSVSWDEGIYTFDSDSLDQSREGTSEPVHCESPRKKSITKPTREEPKNGSELKKKYNVNGRERNSLPVNTSPKKTPKKPNVTEQTYDNRKLRKHIAGLKLRTKSFEGDPIPIDKHESKIRTKSLDANDYDSNLSKPSHRLDNNTDDISTNVHDTVELETTLEWELPVERIRDVGVK